MTPDVKSLPRFEVSTFVCLVSVRERQLLYHYIWCVCVSPKLYQAVQNVLLTESHDLLACIEVQEKTVLEDVLFVGGQVVLLRKTLAV
jgi:hypothetical protein